MSEELDRQLFDAVKNGDLVRMKRLVEVGHKCSKGFMEWTSVDARDEDGYPVIGMTAGSVNPNAFAMVRYFVEHGAYINACDDWALERAIVSKNPEAFSIVKYLVDHGSNITANDGYILGHAVVSDNSNALAIVRYLVECGADVNASDAWNFPGANALRLALYYRESAVKPLNLFMGM